MAEYMKKYWYNNNDEPPEIEMLKNCINSITISDSTIFDMIANKKIVDSVTFRFSNIESEDGSVKSNNLVVTLSYNDEYNTGSTPNRLVASSYSSVFYKKDNPSAYTFNTKIKFDVGDLVAWKHRSRIPSVMKEKITNAIKDKETNFVKNMIKETGLCTQKFDLSRVISESHNGKNYDFYYRVQGHIDPNFIQEDNDEIKEDLNFHYIINCSVLLHPSMEKYCRIKFDIDTGINYQSYIKNNTLNVSSSIIR